MQAGPPGENGSDDLGERLSQLVSTVDDTSRAQAERGRHLVSALVDQLAAGQSETLYSLQSAARSVRTQGLELTRLCDELTEDVGARLAERFEELSEELARQQQDYLEVLRASAEATGSQLSSELEHAADTIVQSAARAKASQTAVRAAAVAAVESLETAASSFAQDAEAITQGMAAVGENFIARLFEVLDERDARERENEQRFHDRMSRLSQSHAAQIADLSEALAQQLERLEARDAAQSATVAAQLESVVDRLLAEPRGRLRELRVLAKSAVATPPPTRVPPRRLPPAPIRTVVHELEEPEDSDELEVPAPVQRRSTTAPRKAAAGRPAPAKTAAPRKRASTPAKTTPKATAKTPAKTTARTRATTKEDS